MPFVDLNHKRKGDPLYNDFRNFLREVWKHLNLPEPSPVQYDIAHYLQYGGRRKMVQAWRGAAKTYITGAFASWLLYRDPNINVMIVSASADFAMQVGSFVRQIINTVPCLSHLIPGKDDQDSRLTFTVTRPVISKDPSMKARGITGQIVGSRADIIIADDVEAPNNSDTAVQRGKLEARTLEFSDIIKPPETSISMIVYLGTPQTEESIYHKLEEKGFDIRVWPAEVPSADLAEKLGDKLAPMIRRMIADGVPIGTPVEPKRFSRQTLDDKKIEVGASRYAMQYLLDPRMSDQHKYPLKVREFICLPGMDPQFAPSRLTWSREKPEELSDLPALAFKGDSFYAPSHKSNETVDFRQRIMRIDASGTGKDETAYAIGAAANGLIYAMEVGGFQENASEGTIGALLAAARRWQVNLISIENASGGDSLAFILRSRIQQEGLRCAVELDKVSQVRKETRIISTLEPLMNQHRIVLNPEIVRKDYEEYRDRPGMDRQTSLQYSFIHQLTRLTSQRGCLVRDDRLDAFSGMVELLAEHTSNDNQKKHEDELQRRRDEEWEAWKKQDKEAARKREEPVSKTWGKSQSHPQMSCRYGVGKGLKRR